MSYGNFSYLGDGLYAAYDGYGIWLHANHHARPTDRVYLEPEVFSALIRLAFKNETLKTLVKGSLDELG